MSDAPRPGGSDIIGLGDGRYAIVTGTARRLAFAATSAGATWVFLDGHVHVVDAPAGRRAARADQNADLMAPMPATVVRIHVQPGQRVAPGDVLIMLEAMKMELPLKAARDATVKNIRCRPGELVQPGVVLIEIE